MRATRARAGWSMLHERNKGKVCLLVLDTAERYEIDLHDWVNVGNHMHLLFQAPSRKQMQAFLRVLPQRIVFVITGTKRSREIGKFWDQLAHSRIIKWGREYEAMKRYLWKNKLEAFGYSKEEIAEFRRHARANPL